MEKELQCCDVANLEKGSHLVKEMAENPLFSGVKDVLEVVGRAVDDVLQRLKADTGSDRGVEDALRGTDEEAGSGEDPAAKKTLHVLKPRFDPDPKCFVICATRTAGLDLPEMRFSESVSGIMAQLWGSSSHRNFKGRKLLDRKAFVIVGLLLEFREKQGDAYMSDAEIAEKSSYSMSSHGSLGRIYGLLEGSGLVIESGGSRGWKIMSQSARR